MSTRTSSTRPNSPHYTKGKKEFIDAMESMLTPDEFRGAMKFNVCKYIWRERHKGEPLNDLRKALTYLSWLREFVETGKITVKEG